MGKALKKINEYKDKDLYVVFYSSMCGYSNALINFLKEHKISFKAYDFAGKQPDFLDIIKEFNDNAKELKFDTNHKTKPVVFFKGKFVGGSDYTISMLSEKMGL